MTVVHLGLVGTYMVECGAIGQGLKTDIELPSSLQPAGLTVPLQSWSSMGRLGP